jgi:preprotein translocase subunit SecA
MVTELKTLYPATVNVDDLADELPEQQELIEFVQEDALAAYDAREEQLGADTMRELERQVLLTVLDRKWREHLYEMDYLREGIGLRAMAQRDPLVEYQREGGDMFNAMMEAFMEEVVGFLFNLEVKVRPSEEEVEVEVVTDDDGEAVTVGDLTASLEAEKPAKADEHAPLAKGLERKADQNLTYSAPDESGEATKSGAKQATSKGKISRNAPCPCGSGKKYKLCHGRAA